MTTLDEALEVVRSLPPGERRLFAETILEELDTIDPEPLSESDLDFIDQRVAAYRSNLQGARPYDEVVDRIRSKHARCLVIRAFRGKVK